MIKLDFRENPLFEFFKGDTDHGISSDCIKDQKTNYVFQLSTLNPYYRYMDYDEEDSMKIVLEKTITVVKSMIENKMDVMIESDSGNLSYDLQDFLNKLLTSEKPNRLLNRSHFHFKVTDNNKKVFDKFVEAINAQVEDLDIQVNITNRYGSLIFQNITIPYIFLLDDNYYQNEFKNLKNYVKSIEDKINEHLSNNDFHVKINDSDFTENASRYTLRFYENGKKEFADFSDSRLAVVDHIIDNILKESFKVRNCNLSLMNKHNGNLSFYGLDFTITRKGNKEVYDGSLC